MSYIFATWYCEGNPKTSPEDCPPLCYSVLQPFHTYVTSSDFAGNAKMVAAQKNMEAGNLLGKSWDCLRNIMSRIYTTCEIIPYQDLVRINDTATSRNILIDIDVPEFLLVCWNERIAWEIYSGDPAPSWENLQDDLIETLCEKFSCCWFHACFLSSHISLLRTFLSKRYIKFLCVIDFMRFCPRIYFLRWHSNITIVFQYYHNGWFYIFILHPPKFITIGNVKWR